MYICVHAYYICLGGFVCACESVYVCVCVYVRVNAHKTHKHTHTAETSKASLPAQEATSAAAPPLRGRAPSFKAKVQRASERASVRASEREREREKD